MSAHRETENQSGFAAPDLSRLPAQHPFDRLARDYDADFTHTRLGRWLRQRVYRHLGDAFHAGEHVLELGCGSGEDAIWLAQRGVRVTATDVSREMLAVAHEKARRTGTEDRIRFEGLDLRMLREGELDLGGSGSATDKFDGAFSNFGALNCLPERRSLAAALANRVRSGGRVLLVAMGPLCAWEILGHVAHGRFRAAGRRFPQEVEAHLAPEESLRVWYPSSRRLRREFDPSFRHLRTVGVGVLLPPTDFAQLVERWPRLFAAAAVIDERLAAVSLSSWLSDHYLLMLERL